ncbi:MAG: SCO family protein [Vulcanimicrobiaceae bacterium]
MKPGATFRHPAAGWMHVALMAVLVVMVAIPLVAVWVTFVKPHVVGTGATDFTLTDQDGRPWTLSQARGHEAVALFFGYTHCPDVCPTTLAKLTRARRTLGREAQALRIVFVTVDAQRDTPAVLKRYVALFDPSVVGLTGPRARTGPVYEAYHVWHQVVPNSSSAAGYLVAHSSAIYPIDRNGRLRSMTDWADSVNELSRDLKGLIS